MNKITPLSPKPAGSWVVKLRCLALGAITLFFITLGIRYVRVYATDFAWFDDMTFIASPLHYLDGTLSFEQLFSQFNEHRVLFHRIIMMTMLLVFDGSFISLVYLTQAFLLFGLLIFGFQLRDQFGGWKQLPFWTAIFPLFLYNTAQSENFIWACQVVYTNSMVLPILSFYLLNRQLGKTGTVSFEVRDWPLWSGILLLNTISSYMSSMGLLVWPAMIFQLLLGVNHNRKDKPLLWLLAAAVGMMGIQWFFYFHGLVRLADHKAEGFIFEEPLYFMEFFISTMGKGLFRTGFYAWLTGLVLLSLFILATVGAIFNRRYARNTAFWLTVAGFMLLQGLAFSVGRAEFRYFLDYDRYSHFSLWLIPAITVCLYFSKDLLRSTGDYTRFFSWGVLGLHVALLPFDLDSYQHGEIKGRLERYSRRHYYQVYRMQNYYGPEKITERVGGVEFSNQAAALFRLGFMPLRHAIDRTQLVSKPKSIESSGNGWDISEEGGQSVFSTRRAAATGAPNGLLTFRKIDVVSKSFITIDVKYGITSDNFAASIAAQQTAVGLDFDHDGRIDEELMPYAIDAQRSGPANTPMQVFPDTWVTLVYFLAEAKSADLTITVKEDMAGDTGWMEARLPVVYGSRELGSDKLLSELVAQPRP